MRLVREVGCVLVWLSIRYQMMPVLFVCEVLLFSAAWQQETWCQHCNLIEHLTEVGECANCKLGIDFAFNIDHYKIRLSLQSFLQVSFCQVEGRQDRGVVDARIHVRSGHEAGRKQARAGVEPGRGNGGGTLPLTCVLLTLPLHPKASASCIAWHVVKFRWRWASLGVRKCWKQCVTLVSGEHIPAGLLRFGVNRGDSGGFWWDSGGSL